MYYTYKCPYCGREFYTYSNLREDASHVLYKAIKQHLIDYGEDRKEYEMDEGEQIESDQIYAGMQELKYKPVSAYEATVTDVTESTTTSSSSSSTTTPSPSQKSSLLLPFLLLLSILVGLIVLFVFFPDVVSSIRGMVPF